ncbi:hypothetical protein Hypma_014584 [Hypsizygus marmoreus]|uniref:Uncharacterized protein n=1 Tax=Hypsizygus marmoreus TaxID=39966 RepID=A0A369JCC1_HYPMA|nr:hypothetical protein Hypma_014584 [Hypsizygus marmoreus]
MTDALGLSQQKNIDGLEDPGEREREKVFYFYFGIEIRMLIPRPPSEARPPRSARVTEQSPPEIGGEPRRSSSGSQMQTQTQNTLEEERARTIRDLE